MPGDARGRRGKRDLGVLGEGARDITERGGVHVEPADHVEVPAVEPGGDLDLEHQDAAADELADATADG